MLYPSNIEQKIGFYKLRNLLKTKCIGQLGRSEVDNMSYNSDFQLIVKQTRQTSEFLNIITEAKNFPVSYYFDIRETLERILTPTAFLSPEELFELKRSFDTIKSILNFFKNDTENKYPNLKEDAAEIKYFKYISDLINMVLDKYGNIKDNASPGLLAVRRELTSKKSSISGIVRRIFEQAKHNNIVNDDTDITVRDGKMLIPVPASSKRKIKGIVYDESASGQTAFIEPIEVIELNNAVRELEFAERREIVKILVHVTEEIKPYQPDLLLAYNFLAKIDFIRAKALLAQEIGANQCKISSKPESDLYNARHPLLVLSYKESERYVVPSQIRLNEEERIILISGPNAGGKSVTLKTLALNQYMLQCGMLPAADAHSVFGIYESLFIDIGDEQDLENDLSTYSSHLLNMKNFTEKANERTLVLIDEFGTGTEPMLGGAIAEAVLADLNAKKVKGIITTHYGNLKLYADNNEGVTNAAMLYDNRNMRPLYILETGIPGSSFAFEIARKTGLSEKILKDAESKLDQTQLDFENLLKETQSEKRHLNRQKREVKAMEAKLRDLQNKYDARLDELLRREKEFAKKIKQDEKEILKSANKRIERAVFEIRKANADREKTKKIRAELEQYISEKEKIREKEERRILDKIERLQNREKRKKKPKNPNQKQDAPKKTLPVEIGSLVKMKGQNTLGEVLEIKKNTALVAFGNLQTRIKTDRLEVVSEQEKRQAQGRKKASVNIIRQREVTGSNFMSSLDVRGKRGDEALQIVRNYIDDALVERRSEIKILHGTGNGILRQLIRDYLSSVPAVSHFRDERIEAGGAGITVVSLDN